MEISKLNLKISVEGKERSDVGNQMTIKTSVMILLWENFSELVTRYTTLKKDKDDHPSYSEVTQSR